VCVLGQALEVDAATTICPEVWGTASPTFHYQPLQSHCSLRQPIVQGVLKDWNVKVHEMAILTVTPKKTVYVWVLHCVEYADFQPTLFS
jgi:hypothetical protein